jgi:hypothetical protein
MGSPRRPSNGVLQSAFFNPLSSTRALQSVFLRFQQPELIPAFRTLLLKQPQVPAPSIQTRVAIIQDHQQIQEKLS